MNEQKLREVVQESMEGHKVEWSDADKKAFENNAVQVAQRVSQVLSHSRGKTYDLLARVFHEDGVINWDVTERGMRYTSAGIENILRTRIRNEREKQNRLKQDPEVPSGSKPTYARVKATNQRRRGPVYKKIRNEND